MQQAVEVYQFSTNSNVYCKNIDNINANTRIVVDDHGYLELGEVKRKQDIENTDFVDFVRIATEEDFKNMCNNCKDARHVLPEIKLEADRLGLDMKIGYVSYNLDRTKLTINYTADGRIDFRELIKILGAKYKTRIEMKQIGYRDESKIIGAIGVCGRETCCKLFLNDFDKVSIKMAKNQDIALNPTRINGMCGRLLCCLKYEDEYYAEMKKKMPKLNSIVSTPDGNGIVDSVDIFKETINVKFEKEDSFEIKSYELKDISLINKDK